MFSTLRNKIVEILEDNDKIQETFPYEVEKFKGDPVCTVTPSSNEGDYNTTDENIRLYSFNIRLYVTRTETRTKKQADEVLTDLVDSVIDDFDKNYTFTGISMPTGYTFINSFVLPSNWGYYGREAEYRYAELLIKCRVSVDINAIS
ncbi:MAG: hypothetical protein KAT66_00780 [Candidatus Lokiarchaeota archaeon]|nr:hypothetical protein [Candidatus Lokiarchaeota archaeon]